MLNSLVVIIVTLIFLTILFHKKVRQSDTWRATVTPLASIIGSGFLISAPLLILSTGYYAPIAMGIIVIIAYALGSSLRFNILHAESSSLNDSSFALGTLEFISRAILAIAYLISITFYLKLLSTFLLKGMNVNLNYGECIEN